MCLYECYMRAVAAFVYNNFYFIFVCVYFDFFFHLFIHLLPYEHNVSALCVVFVGPLREPYGQGNHLVIK